MALGILLCLLATLFAVEAKLAWYGPDTGATAQLSSSKLQPADAPKLIAQALISASPVVWFAQIAAILLLPFLLRRVGVVSHRARAVRIPGSPGFSPSLFLRPPPCR